MCNNVNNNSNNDSKNNDSNSNNRTSLFRSEIRQIGTVRTFSSTRRMLDDSEGPGNDLSVEEERQMNIKMQEDHATRLTIAGLPSHLEDHQLEDEVLKLFDTMHAKIDHEDIEDVFRPGRSTMVVCRFFDPASVNVVMSKSGALKDLDLYG